MKRDVVFTWHGARVPGLARATAVVFLVVVWLDCDVLPADQEERFCFATVNPQVLEAALPIPGLCQGLSERQTLTDGWESSTRGKNHPCSTSGCV